MEPSEAKSSVDPVPSAQLCPNCKKQLKYEKSVYTCAGCGKRFICPLKYKDLNDMPSPKEPPTKESQTTEPSPPKIDVTPQNDETAIPIYSENLNSSILSTNDIPYMTPQFKIKPNSLKSQLTKSKKETRQYKTLYETAKRELNDANETLAQEFQQKQELEAENKKLIDRIRTMSKQHEAEIARLSSAQPPVKAEPSSSSSSDVQIIDKQTARIAFLRNKLEKRARDFRDLQTKLDRLGRVHARETEQKDKELAESRQKVEELEGELKDLQESHDSLRLDLKAYRSLLRREEEERGSVKKRPRVFMLDVEE